MSALSKRSLIRLCGRPYPGGSSSHITTLSMQPSRGAMTTERRSTAARAASRSELTPPGDAMVMTTSWRASSMLPSNNTWWTVSDWGTPCAAVCQVWMSAHRLTCLMDVRLGPGQAGVEVSGGSLSLRRTCDRVTSPCSRGSGPQGRFISGFDHFLRHRGAGRAPTSPVVRRGKWPPSLHDGSKADPRAMAAPCPGRDCGAQGQRRRGPLPKGGITIGSATCQPREVLGPRSRIMAVCSATR